MRGGRIIPAPEVQLAVTYQQVGRKDEAQAAVQAIRQVEPRYSLKVVSRGFPYKKSVDMERFLDALRKAGMPE